MVVVAHAAPLEEIVQVLAVVGQEVVDTHLHLLQIQAGSHLEEGRDAGLQVPAGNVPVAVRHQFRQVVVQVNLVLQRNGDLGGLRRVHKVNQAPQGRVLVNEVSQLMTNHKLELVLVHEVEQLRVHIDDVRVFTVFCRNGKGVDGGVAGDIVVHFLLKVQALLDFMAQVVKVPQQVFVGLHAVAFHPAPPIVVVGAPLGIFEDKAYYIALKGMINLAGKRLLQLNLGFKDSGHNGCYMGYWEIRFLSLLSSASRLK